MLERQRPNVARRLDDRKRFGHLAVSRKQVTLARGRPASIHSRGKRPTPPLQVIEHPRASSTLPSAISVST